MNSDSSAFERYGLLAFLVLIPLLTLAVALLPLPAEVLPLLMVLVPAVLAVLLTFFARGRAGTGALFRRLFQWRVRPSWYAAALALALLARMAISALAWLLGWIPSIPSCARGRFRSS